jgi:nitronate monooxygenase
MRALAVERGDVQRMQAWAGQSGALARQVPAGDLVRQLWTEAGAILDLA